MFLISLIPIFIVSAFALSTPVKKQNKEGYKDIIQKSKLLSLQRDRIQAAQILRMAILKEGPQSEAAKELVPQLKKASEIFYTDKAQQFYELAESMQTENPAVAIDTFKDALKVEDSNVAVLKGLSRQYLRMDDCNNSLNAAQKAENMNPFLEDIAYIKAEALACLNKWDAMELWVADKKWVKGPRWQFWQSLLYKNKNENWKAVESLSDAIKKDPDFPESYLQLGLLQIEVSPKTAYDNLKKYVDKCSGIKKI